MAKEKVRLAGMHDAWDETNPLHERLRGWPKCPSCGSEARAYEKEFDGGAKGPARTTMTAGCIKPKAGALCARNSAMSECEPKGMGAGERKRFRKSSLDALEFWWRRWVMPAEQERQARELALREARALEKAVPDVGQGVGDVRL